TNPVFNSNQVIIYKNPSNAFVINTGNFTMASIKVFDIRGRMLQEKKDINASETRINVGDTNQMLLVQITTTEGLKVIKKVIN
uniref:T9SS sorting signal type C domain-containing protein n=1 Tax=Flavobacterium sp. TaxID=239 RepID=UPI002FDAAFB8